MTMRKVCTGCKADKPLSEFSRQAKSPDGHRTKCKACTKVENANWYLLNREDKLAQNKKWAIENREAKNALSRKYQKQRKSYYSAHNKEWHKKHKDDPVFRERVRTKSRNRLVRVRRATPSWISAIEAAQMQEFYDIAKARSMQTGERYEVDHIIPLGGFMVSGLHVPWNLQIIREEENLAKGTRIMGNA
tara:strand:+ start:86 stop:655 length:570 start_codon:yes stop_codon:yes gene_type:complete